jgi:mono/diheme cytochrome c family protein
MITSARGEPLRKKRRHLKNLLAAFMLGSSLLSAQTVGIKDVSVTAVEGESWLRHLHRSFNDTSMGKTWDLGPPPPIPGEESPRWQLELSLGYAAQPVLLHGSDLYRLNCQGCHGGTGSGAPPEINSVINPVRATSVAIILERTKKTGQDMSRGDAAELAKQAKVLLLQRLHKGGEAMPPFPHLGEPEIRSIVAYLEQLSEVPGAERNQIAVKESPSRVGEQIVKSTCHICHSAVGPNPNPQQLYDGVIPPLSTLTTRTSLPEFVRKVTIGVPVVMGTAPLSYRDSYTGRMPVFRYLSQDEAADAYLYLTLYPPHE